MRRRLRRLTLGIAILFAATAGTVMAGSTASAGTNGQQIAFYDAEGIAFSVSVSGKNQNGQSVYQCWRTPYTNNYFTGSWRVGYQAVNWYSDSNCKNFIHGVTPYVPREQTSNWFWVSNG